jgi:hypothetical protein
LPFAIMANAQMLALPCRMHNALFRVTTTPTEDFTPHYSLIKAKILWMVIQRITSSSQAALCYVVSHRVLTAPATAEDAGILHCISRSYHSPSYCLILSHLSIFRPQVKRG